MARDLRSSTRAADPKPGDFTKFAKDAALLVTESFVPGVGEAMDLQMIKEGKEQGDDVKVAMGMIGLTLPMMAGAAWRKLGAPLFSKLAPLLRRGEITPDQAVQQMGELVQGPPVLPRGEGYLDLPPVDTPLADVSVDAERNLLQTIADEGRLDTNYTDMANRPEPGGPQSTIAHHRLRPETELDRIDDELDRLEGYHAGTDEEDWWETVKQKERFDANVPSEDKIIAAKDAYDKVGMEPRYSPATRGGYDGPHVRENLSRLEELGGDLPESLLPPGANDNTAFQILPGAPGSTARHIGKPEVPVPDAESEESILSILSGRGLGGNDWTDMSNASSRVPVERRYPGEVQTPHTAMGDLPIQHQVYPPVPDHAPQMGLDDEDRILQLLGYVDENTAFMPTRSKRWTPGTSTDIDGNPVYRKFSTEEQIANLQASTLDANRSKVRPETYERERGKLDEQFIDLARRDTPTDRTIGQNIHGVGAQYRMMDTKMSPEALERQLAQMDAESAKYKSELADTERHFYDSRPERFNPGETAAGSVYPPKPPLTPLPPEMLAMNQDQIEELYWQASNKKNQLSDALSANRKLSQHPTDALIEHKRLMEEYRKARTLMNQLHERTLHLIKTR